MTIVLDASDVERLLPVDRCIQVVGDALGALARGDAGQPLRTMYAPPGGQATMAWMPAHRAGQDPAYAAKVLCIVHDNPRRGLDAHQGAVLIMDGTTGELTGILNASAVTAIRTAATSAVATRLLARPDASELGIVGAGVQARWHLRALPCVRRIGRARIAGRTPDGARSLARAVGEELELEVVPVANAEEAVRGADIVVTATTARQPVLDRAWLAPGCHVNAVGMGSPGSRELDVATVAAASLFADRRESVENEAEEYKAALRQGAIQPGHVRAELGELVIGRAPGRTSADEITLFRSLGLAVEDLAAGAYAVAEARRTGAGTEVSF